MLLVYQYLIQIKVTSLNLERRGEGIINIIVLFIILKITAPKNLIVMYDISAG